MQKQSDDTDSHHRIAKNHNFPAAGYLKRSSNEPKDSNHTPK